VIDFLESLPPLVGVGCAGFGAGVGLLEWIASEQSWKPPSWVLTSATIIAVAMVVVGLLLIGHGLAHRRPKKTNTSKELREVLADVSKEGHAILPAASEASYNAWIERGAAKIARYDAFSAERFKRGFDPSQPLLHPSVERFINWRLDLLNEIASQTK
jgi:hypothetical protein